MFFIGPMHDWEVNLGSSFSELFYYLKIRMRQGS